MDNNGNQKKLMVELVDRLDKIPPFITFAIALGRKKPPTPEQLIAATGFSKATFFRIARSLTWEEIKIGKASRFAAACGVDLYRQGKHWIFLRRAVKGGTLFCRLPKPMRDDIDLRCRKCLALVSQRRGSQIAADSSRTRPQLEPAPRR